MYIHIRNSVRVSISIDFFLSTGFSIVLCMHNPQCISTHTKSFFIKIIRTKLINRNFTWYLSLLSSSASVPRKCLQMVQFVENDLNGNIFESHGLHRAFPLICCFNIVAKQNVHSVNYIPCVSWLKTSIWNDVGEVLKNDNFRSWRWRRKVNGIEENGFLPKKFYHKFVWFGSWNEWMDEKEKKNAKNG